MILRHRPQHPQTVLRLGMLCLVLGLAAPWFLHPASAFWRDALHAARGFFLGAAIPLNLWALRLSRGARCAEQG
jgi:hypothetical protein